MRAMLIIAALTLAGCQTGPAPKNTNLATVAIKYVGLQERKNRSKLKAVVGVDPVRIRWCGAFLGAVVKQSGHTPPEGYLKASNWKHFGKPVKPSKARKGDVVVMRNHVTIFLESNGHRVCGVGGNQSNSVRESCYRSSKVIAYRRAK